MSDPSFIIVRFSNETGKPVELMVEPWATQVTIPPGSRFAIHYRPPDDRPDTTYTEFYEDMVRFQCEGDTFEIEIDGKRIEA